jgi:2-polyprenyl-3-methyl-5-hydroxy-6-metoxy-1,4-benzoquinol methylase
MCTIFVYNTFSHFSIFCIKKQAVFFVKAKDKVEQMLLSYKTKSPIFQNKISKSVDIALSIPIKEIDVRYSQTNHCYENILFEEINDSYDFDYDNNQNSSPRFQKHVADIINEFKRRFDTSTSIVEIGCGNGYFIDELFKAGYHNVIGYDKAYSGASPLIRSKFLDTADECTADLIVLRHTLEHIKNPKMFLNFLSQMKNSRGEAPYIYIEVPNMTYILKNLMFEDIFYEHVNYFTDFSFDEMFPKNDYLETFDDQYISVFAKLSDLSSNEDLVVSYSKKYTDQKFEILQEKRDRIIHDYSNKKLIIWGCGAKGNTLAFMLKQKNSNIEIACVDVDTNKQGKYLSGSGFLIQAFEDVADVSSYDSILVMNSSYVNEIKDIIPQAYYSKIKTMEDL